MRACWQANEFLSPVGTDNWFNQGQAQGTEVEADALAMQMLRKHDDSVLNKWVTEALTEEGRFLQVRCACRCVCDCRPTDFTPNSYSFQHISTSISKKRNLQGNLCAKFF